MQKLMLLISFILTTAMFPQDFTEINTVITGVAHGISAWGDLDNDGDLDIVVNGDSGVKIYRNDGGGIFSDTGFSTGHYSYENVDLGDYNNNGYIDILLSGMNGTKIYRNNGDWTFTQLSTDFPMGGMSETNALWGDFDNDGYLDVLLTGRVSGTGNVTRIYRNDGNGIFTDINAGLPGLDYGRVALVDYNCDGLLDVMLMGRDNTNMTVTFIYKNEGNGVFTDINAGLPGVYQGSADWGDYNNDGYPDLLLTGALTTRIFRNEGNGAFTDINAGLTGVSAGSAEWGDFNNNGNLDILLTGAVSHDVRTTKIYRNDGNGVFTDINAAFPGVSYGHATWGDYDNDGDLDFILTGYDGSNRIAKLYRNNCETPNTVPSKPSMLVTDIVNDGMLLSFNPASDNETPQAGLTYNINVAVNNKNYISAMSDLSNGYRRIVKKGNLNYRRSYKVTVANLPQEEKSIKWNVQAIDNCFAGSEFAESCDLVLPSPRDLSLSNKTLMSEHDLLKWEFVSPLILDHYIIQIDKDIYFRTPIESNYELSKASETENTEGQKLIYISKALKDFAGYETMRKDSIYYWRIKPVYIDRERITIFSEEPKSFVYLPTDITPGIPQNITLSYSETSVNINWDPVEVKEKGLTYRLYSTQDPYAEFPAGYTLEQSGITTTSWTEPLSSNKKFYVVTAYYSL